MMHGNSHFIRCWWNVFDKSQVGVVPVINTRHPLWKDLDEREWPVQNGSSFGSAQQQLLQMWITPPHTWDHILSLHITSYRCLSHPIPAYPCLSRPHTSVPGSIPHRLSTPSGHQRAHQSATKASIQMSESQSWVDQNGCLWWTDDFQGISSSEMTGKHDVNDVSLRSLNKIQF